MKQFIFIMLSVLLATANVYAQDGAVIEADKTTHDFGIIKESDGDATHSFVIKNTGTAPLVITRVIASCGCTTPEWTKEPIAPGQTGEIKVTYDPKGRPGTFAKTINVYSNGKKGSYVLTIKGEVN
ncbi:MAG: DUF1573 domain-containing protein [Tannerellaceae bacterium]|nr:DUF1573 domain-containing protein [Tannerellaceae bacterium]